MPEDNEFFDELKEWSIRKLTIVRKYLDGFAKILGNFGQGRVYYVDGFAGRGTYHKGDKGSPVLAAEIAKRCREESKRFGLYCINIEKDHDNFANLKAETSCFGDLVKNLEGTFTENLNTILQIISDSPTFFFLDDFGICGTEWEAVEKVIRRKAPTDLWIRFDHRTVRRIDGFFDSPVKGANIKFSRLNQLYGIKDLNLLHKYLDGPSPESRIQNALNLYLKRLEESYCFWNKQGYAAAYPIISINGQRKYHLVFACSHPRAAILASDIVNIAEESYQKEAQEFRERQSLQLPLFSLDPTPDKILIDKVARLKQVIWQSCRGQILTRSDVHYHAICMDNKAWFGKIRGMHLTKALKSLEEEDNRKIMYSGALSNGNTRIVFSR